MALIAIPLIIGIGIDNGIHIARRYLESGEGDIVEILRRSGAALLQSNLTTVIGFGALVVSSFEPLAELGLVTALGVGLALIGALFLFPTLIIVFRIRPRQGRLIREGLA
jgi:predicted RND superfamily exporter protein